MEKKTYILFGCSSKDSRFLICHMHSYTRTTRSEMYPEPLQVQTKNQNRKFKTTDLNN